MELSLEILELYVVAAAVPSEATQGASCLSLHCRQLVAGLDTRGGLMDGLFNFGQCEFAAKEGQVGADGGALSHHHVTSGAPAGSKEIALSPAERLPGGLLSDATEFHERTSIVIESSSAGGRSKAGILVTELAANYAAEFIDGARTKATAVCQIGTALGSVSVAMAYRTVLLKKLAIILRDGSQSNGQENEEPHVPCDCTGYFDFRSIGHGFDEFHQAALGMLDTSTIVVVAGVEPALADLLHESPDVGLRAVDVGEAIFSRQLAGANRFLIPSGLVDVGCQCDDGALT